MSESGYVGRFAPSPTGRLHMGSLVAAVASWCDARYHDGRWLVRMEDLDPPREVPGAADDILRTLEAFGLHWDDEVVFQSRRHEHYLAALQELHEQGRVFPCACSRKELSGQSVYPGYCRDGLSPGRNGRSERFSFHAGTWSWQDAVQGEQDFDAELLGDFVVRRADGLWAYQLAVVVDDIAQGVNAIVRGADLLESTPRQLALRAALAPEFPVSDWAHLPVLVNAEDQKLSKQTLAAPIDPEQGVSHLLSALEILGQPVEDLRGQDQGNLEELLNWAAAHWEIRKVPRGPIHWQGEGQGAGRA